MGLLGSYRRRGMRWATSSIRRHAAAALIIGTLGALVVGESGAAGAAGPTRLPSLPGPLVHGRVIGAVASAKRLRLTVVLKVADPAALRAFVDQVSNPASPMYRSYLTPAEFGRRFGASPSVLAAVISSLRAKGLTPRAVSANRLSISVNATASQVQSAFRLRLRQMALRDGSQAVVASAPPALDPGIAPDVQTILGLTSVSRPHPLIRWPAESVRRAAMAPRASRHVATGGPQPCSAASSVAQQDGSYTADQIAAAYGFSGLYAAGDQGQGETVALYELEPNDPADIAAYQACYGTHAAVAYVPVDGGAGTGEGSGEATLDIENTIGLAPRASYLVYQGPNASQSVPGSGPYDVFSAIVNQDRANVVSVSWGECEQLEGSSGAQAESTLFEQAAAEGQSIVSATGDEGSEDCNGANNVPDPALAVDDPSSQPFVTAVGGTTMSQPGPPPTQSVWNNGGNVSGLVGVQPGAGGGGISALWGMPGYQSRAPAWLGVVNARSSGASCAASSGYCRQTPDVSANADPSTGYVIYFNGSGGDPTLPSGWQTVGGTSAAAPVWAALLALADASAACHGSPVGFANPALYQAAARGYSSVLQDITSGNNDFTGTNGGLYPAGVGYDMASGLGTPNATPLAAALCADALRLRDPGPQRSIVGQAVKLQMIATGPLDGTPTYVANGLPPGLTLLRSSGRIVGKPKKPGHYTPAVVILDSSLAVRGIAFQWTVEGAPRVTAASLTGAGGARPRLRMTIRSGAGEPGLKKLVLALPRGLRLAGARIAIAGPGGRRIRAHTRLNAGRLLVFFLGAPTRVSLTIAYPSLTATSAISSRVRSHRLSSLVMRLTASDARRQRTTLRVRLSTRS